MLYEWDNAKDAENRRKHGLRLADGVPALAHPRCVEWIDDRLDYGEERMRAVGPLGERLLHVVYMRRGDVSRLISVRKATRDEAVRYYQNLL